MLKIARAVMAALAVRHRDSYWIWFQYKQI
jgi:hypothetical protein